MKASDSVATDSEIKTGTPEVPTPAVEESLGRKVLRGAGWEIAGQFAMQVWRFGSNLLLTRILVPEAFGLLGIVQVFMMSLALLSDVGLQSSVIHDRRGDEKRFLDTVWTVSLLRGFIMWLVTCLLAGPFAEFFAMPELRMLLPVTALAAIARGAASTSLLTASRNLRNDWYVRVEFGSQLIGTTITILLALWLRSAMALALGWVATSCAASVLSYCRRDIEFNRLCWDREIARSLSQFGRWALLSGLFTIVQQRGDRLALGKLITTGQLGTYVIGSNLAIYPMTVFIRLNSAVGQPLYARVRHLSPEVARSKIRRFRLGMTVMQVPVLAGFVLFGQQLVDLVYGPAYARAGWYCALASLAGLMRVGAEPGPVFLAHGDSWSHMKIMAARTIMLIVAMVGGYFVGSAMGSASNGVLYGVVIAPLLAYPYQAAMYQRVNAWLPEVDVLAFVPALLLLVAKAWSLI